jgi:tetratricopeptide (TPR) repeat protein
LAAIKSRTIECKDDAGCEQVTPCPKPEMNPGAAVQSRRPIKVNRVSVKQISCVIAVLLFTSGVALPQKRAREQSSVPPLPRIVLETFPPSIREKVHEAYTRALANPLDPQANGQLGMILQAYNPPDSNAEICYRRARAIDPSSFRWVYYLALIQEDQKRFTEAATSFREVLALHPEYLPAELKLGQCLLRSGEVGEARSTFKRTLGHHPQSAQVYLELGRAEEARGDLNAASESFRKAIEWFPHFGAAHYALALADQRLGKVAESRDAFALAETYKVESPDAADPLMADLRSLYTDPQYFMAMGLYFAGQGRWKEAVAEHEKALLFDPDLLQAHANLISLYGRLGAFDKAEEHYRAAIKIDSKNPRAHYDYGVLLEEQGRLAEAKQAFEKTLEADPANASAHNSLGDILQREGKLEAAAVEFRKAIASNPEFPQAHFNLGRILVNQGHFAQGIPELLKTLNTPDEDAKASYLYAVGAAYARSGDRQNGLKYMREAREQAATRHQAKLIESIDGDLRLLQESKNRD